MAANANANKKGLIRFTLDYFLSCDRCGGGADSSAGHGTSFRSSTRKRKAQLPSCLFDV